MAIYVITESPDVDWDDEYRYKYRYESRDGSPTAEAEMGRRRAEGRPAFLWRWADNAATLIESIELGPSNPQAPPGAGAIPETPTSVTEG